MSLLEGLSGYYELDGLRGVMRISAYRLFGRPREISVHPETVKLPIHLRLRTSDISIYKDVLLGHEYDAELPFIPQCIEVDCGANIGLASIYFANKYPQAQIIALEPETSNFELLVRNVSGYRNILPIQVALWKENGEVGLSGSSKFAFQVCRGQGVRAITMNTLMSEAGLDQIDVLKVDIEGAEKEVFQSCDWMPRIRVLMIELHDSLKPGGRPLSWQLRVGPRGAAER